jgi:hypothetical protein
MNQFTRKPGAQPQDTSVEAFIEAAGKPAVDTVLPWEGLDDRRSRELFTLRLTEAEKAKLQFIVENTKFKSMQEFCMQALRAVMEAEIQRLTKTEA